ncbi:hypothetical protein AMATHDRAFT_69281 [Amanita thiersii Skay4041]|uniref:Uncharacterized protein n=1 Tax=Amanita thiersii Skay4041 TaxID=703135 RepID=A0A2A9N7X0_9AGAR|nr:hypothetical protein AMATHDRAFT_69281 [Amanita thiersii Skay4041]
MDGPCSKVIDDLRVEADGISLVSDSDIGPEGSSSSVLGNSMTLNGSDLVPLIASSLPSSSNSGLFDKLRCCTGGDQSRWNVSDTLRISLSAEPLSRQDLLLVSYGDEKLQRITQETFAV